MGQRSEDIGALRNENAAAWDGRFDELKQLVHSLRAQVADLNKADRLRHAKILFQDIAATVNKALLGPFATDGSNPLCITQLHGGCYAIKRFNSRGESDEVRVVDLPLAEQAEFKTLQARVDALFPLDTLVQISRDTVALRSELAHKVPAKYADDVHFRALMDEAATEDPLFASAVALRDLLIQLRGGHTPLRAILSDIFRE